MAFLKPNGEAWNLAYVASGRSGVILYLNPTRVVKAPYISYSMDASEQRKRHEDFFREDNINCLENEMATFQRLGHYEHIVEWYTLRSDGIEMKYMSHGSLPWFLQDHTPSKKQLHSWFCSIAAAIAYAHSRNVIVGDVAARNILIDDDLSAKLCDFSDSAILSFDVDIGNAIQDGASIHTDIFQFGNVVYETTTGKRSDFDPYHSSGLREKQGACVIPCWPDKNLLPSIGHLDYGATILKCWSRDFENMSSVAAEIQSYDY